METCQHNSSLVDVTCTVILPTPESTRVVYEVSEKDGAGDASKDAGDHGL